MLYFSKIVCKEIITIGTHWFKKNAHKMKAIIDILFFKYIIYFLVGTYWKYFELLSLRVPTLSFYGK